MTSFKQLSYEQVVAAAKAYITLSLITSVIRSIADCRIFVFSLDNLHKWQNYFGDTIMPEFFGLFQLPAH
jgi:hypothetical protein